MLPLKLVISATRLSRKETRLLACWLGAHPHCKSRTVTNHPKKKKKNHTTHRHGAIILSRQTKDAPRLENSRVDSTMFVSRARVASLLRGVSTRCVHTLSNNPHFV